MEYLARKKRENNVCHEKFIEIMQCEILRLSLKMYFVIEICVQIFRESPL